jgi:hypothetical protein
MVGRQQADEGQELEYDDTMKDCQGWQEDNAMKGRRTRQKQDKGKGHNA